MDMLHMLPPAGGLARSAPAAPPQGTERNAETIVSLARVLVTKNDALNNALIEESKADNSKFTVQIERKDFNEVIIRGTTKEEPPK